VLTEFQLRTAIYTRKTQNSFRLLLDFAVPQTGNTTAALLRKVDQNENDSRDTQHDMRHSQHREFFLHRINELKA